MKFDMQHTRFLKQKISEYTDEINNLQNQINEFERKIAHLEDMLVCEQEPQSGDVSTPNHLSNRTEIVTTKSLALKLLLNSDDHRLTLDEIIALANIEGQRLTRGTLQSTLSRNKDDFKSIDPKIGKWGLTERHTRELFDLHSPISEGYKAFTDEENPNLHEGGYFPDEDFDESSPLE